MSSILDALNKLESEKDAGADGQDDLTQEMAEKELTGGGPLSDRMTIRMKPVTFVFVSLAFCAVLVTSSIGIFVTLTRPNAAPSPSSQATIVPVTNLQNETPAPSSPNEDGGVVREVVAESSGTITKTITPAPNTVLIDVEVKTDVEVAPTQVAQVASPEPEAVVPPQKVVQEVVEDVLPEPAEAPTLAPLTSADYEKLPRMSEREKEVRGLSDLLVNMVFPVGPDHPRALAVINLKKVYQGHRIGNSRATLVHVSKKGVALAFIETGDRFFVDF